MTSSTAQRRSSYDGIKKIGSQRNLSEIVRDRLVRMVVARQISAGDRINEVQFAESLGVSRGPVREAAKELEGRGLLISRPRLGFFVAGMTRKQVEDLADLKDLLDSAAVQDHITNLDDATIADTIARHDRVPIDNRAEFLEAMLHLREYQANLLDNRILAEHFLVLVRRLYIMSAMVDAPDENERMRSVVSASRGSWEAIARKDKQEAEAVLNRDTRHWRKHLAPRFPEEHK